MIKVSFCWLAAAFYCCEALSQTDSPAPRTLFSLPHSGLKRLECEPEPSRTAKPPPRTLPQQTVIAPTMPLAASSNDLASANVGVQLSSSAKDDFFEKLDVYRRLDQGGYLTRPGHSENILERSIDATFRPEPVPVGKTMLSCSLITAIKRKNPFCLLNPIFFQWSW